MYQLDPGPATALVCQPVPSAGVPIVSTEEEVPDSQPQVTETQLSQGGISLLVNEMHTCGEQP